MTDSLVVISESAFKECPGLRRPLNDALKEIQGNILSEPVQIYQVEPFDVEVTSNTPGLGPWPLLVSQVPASVFGVLVLRADNLTVSGQVPTSAISVTQWDSDSDSVRVGFITGLTLNDTYRITLGFLYA